MRSISSTAFYIVTLTMGGGGFATQETPPLDPPLNNNIKIKKEGMSHNKAIIIMHVHMQLIHIKPLNFVQ